MDYSVVLFDLKTEGAPSEKPLMLQPVLFCPVLAWVCQELRACGAQRFFAVCDADAREEVLAAAEGFDLTCVDSAEEALARSGGKPLALSPAWPGLGAELEAQKKLPELGKSVAGMACAKLLDKLLPGAEK